MTSQPHIQPLQRKHTWIMYEVQRIGRSRFPPVYWPSLEHALHTCLESHSLVMQTGPQQLGGFVLVCPPAAATNYGPLAKPWTLLNLEVAFVATDSHWEGKGFARRMMSEVLLCCKTTQQGCWLHVDTINTRAKQLYASLGFAEAVCLPDPYGSEGALMVWSPGRQAHMHVGQTLVHAPAREAEEPLRRSVFTPPLVTCG